MNTGSTAVSLSGVTIRYYYTREKAVDQQVPIWWCSVGSGPVSGVYSAAGYVEISFSASAGNLAAGASVQLSFGINNADWSNYDQANDYSFGPTMASFADYSKVTVWQGGNLVWGVAP